MKLRHGNGSVRARNGFFSTPATSDPELSRKADLALAARSPFNFTAVPLRVNWTGQTPDGAKKKAGFAMTVSAGRANIDTENQNLMNLDFAVVARRLDGSVAAQVAQNVKTNLKPEALKQVQQHGVTYRNALPLDPGNYEVRFIVRDNMSGTVGSVLAKLKVQ